MGEMPSWSICDDCEADAMRFDDGIARLEVENRT
jgi:hypothetical protein